MNIVELPETVLLKAFTRTTIRIYYVLYKKTIAATSRRGKMKVTFSLKGINK